MDNNTERRGQFGMARPAFTVHRFKRTIIAALNEEMAEKLNEVLEENERLKGTVTPCLYEFATQLQEALDQPPPSKGEKPEVLAPGRPNKKAV
jgi:hypothetical protein